MERAAALSRPPAASVLRDSPAAGGGCGGPPLSGEQDRHQR